MSEKIIGHVLSSVDVDERLSLFSVDSDGAVLVLLKAMGQAECVVVRLMLADVSQLQALLAKAAEVLQ